MNMIVVSSCLTTWRIMTSAGFKYESDMQRDVSVNEKLPAPDYALILALERARKSFEMNPHDIVVGTSAVLTINGKKIAPPGTEAQAAELLERLSGGLHKIYSSIAILSEGRQTNFFEDSKVRMRKFSHEVIRRYVATGEVFSSATGYSLLGKGASLVESVTGDWYAAAGVPLLGLAKRLDNIYGIVPF